MTTETTAIHDLTTAESRWQAVLNRDETAIGQFILAVRTTGIYCRPGCPARTPKRENVLFFDTIAEAERAGFRACKRCHPKAPSLAQRNMDIIRRACETIENTETIPSLEQLAREAQLSKHHFHRMFKSTTGLTPGEYARSHRAQRMRQQLPAASSITRAIYEAGYQSSGRFYATATMSLGMTPTSFRQGGTGESIRFAIAETSIGAMLVAATAKGICAIAFGDEPGELIEHLEEQFPRAEIIDADPDFEDIVSTVVASVETPSLTKHLPLDLRGTAFQHRVWNALREIPAGTTLTYSDLARQIDSPSSARAVARACATNNVALVVPCHRVIRKSGDLAGYRWGIERKQALLDRERSS